jgi:hypothetical protein
VPNLFVSYDLMDQKNYLKIEAGIKALGEATRVHYSLFYVKSKHSGKEAADLLAPAIDADDRLIVIEAANAAWLRVNQGTDKFMLDRW